MKKNIFIGFIFVILSIIIFKYYFANMEKERLERFIYLGENENNTKVLISCGIENIEYTYNIIKNALQKYKGVIHFTDTDARDNRTIYKKYILFSDTSLFRNIDLISGRFFDLSENESNLFLSSIETGEYGQIGLIDAFAGGFVYEIRTIKSKMINDKENIFNKYIYLNLRDSGNADLMVSDIRNQGIAIETMREPSFKTEDKVVKLIMILVPAICYLLCILLVYYDLLNSYKKIGIEKMLGFLPLEIYKKRIVPILFIQIVASLLTNFILIIFNFKQFGAGFKNFAVYIAGIQGLMFAASLFILSIPFLYIKRIRISAMLKNKDPVNSIVAVNLLFKTAFTVIMGVLLILTLNNYSSVMTYYNSSIKEWEKTKSLFIIPSFPTAGLSPESAAAYLDSKEYLNIQKKLYMHFNSRGAIYADFNSFENKTYRLNSKTLIDKCKTDIIQVNPNYLVKHPIIDANNKIISIAEDDGDYILLVPEQYKNCEDKIIEHHTVIKNSRETKESHHDHKEHSSFAIEAYSGPSIVNGQKIKIIWIKQNQRLFSYRLDINPDLGNCVIDPVIRVITSVNGDLCDYGVVTGYMGSPFKINTQRTEDIALKLSGYYDLKTNKFPIISVYGAVKDQIQRIKNEMLYLGLIILIFAVIIISIIVQNTANYCKQYKLRLAIQKFLGYRRIDKYKGYIELACLNWLTVTVFLLIFAKSLLVLVICGALIFFEVIITCILFGHIEKNEIIKVTKGG